MSFTGFARKYIAKAALALLLIAVMSLYPLQVYAESTREVIYTSDLYYLYPHYLKTGNVNLNSCYNDATSALSDITEMEQWLIAGESAMQDPVGYITGWISSELGVSSSLDKKANEGAARAVLEKMADSPGIAKAAASSMKESKKAFEIIQTTSDWSQELMKMQFPGVKNEKIKQIITDEDNWEVIGSMSAVLKTEQDIMDFAATIELCEVLTLSELDYIIDNVDENLGYPFRHYRNMINAEDFDGGYAAYIAEKYLQEKVIDEILDVENMIKALETTPGEVSGIYAVVAATCKLAGIAIEKIFGFGDAETYLTVSKLKYITDQLRNASDINGYYFKTNPPTYESVQNYEMGYEIYVAALKAYTSEAKDVNRAHEDLLDFDLSLVKEFSVDTHYEDCKSAILEINKDARVTVTEDPEKFFDYTGYGHPVTVTGPSDTIEEGKIYTAEGVLHFNVKAQNGVVFDTDAVTKNIEVTGQGNVATKGHAVSIRDLISTGSLTYLPGESETLNVDNIVNNCNMTLTNANINVEDSVYSSREDYVGTLTINGGNITVGEDVKVEKVGGLDLFAANVTVNGDVSIDGRYLAFNDAMHFGINLGTNTYLLIKGNLSFNSRSDAMNGYWNVEPYCQLGNGTIELKGDFLDNTDYAGAEYNHNPAWYASENFNLIFSGDRIQNVKIPRHYTDFDSTNANKWILGKVTVTSPGIRAEGYLDIVELLSDARIYGDVAGLTIWKPVDGHNIEFFDNVTVKNIGSPNYTYGLALTNGSKITCHKDLSLDGIMKLQDSSELDIDGNYHGIYKYDGNYYPYYEGVLYLTDGSSMSVGGNAELLDKAGLSVTDSSLDVAGDFTAYGYFNDSRLTGLSINPNAAMSVGGDMQITCRSSTQYRDSYCSFSSGTLELKGDLIDASNYNVSGSSIKPAWAAGSDFNLIMSGSEIQTIKAVSRAVNVSEDTYNYNALGNLTVTSPGIRAEGCLFTTSIQSNAKVYGDVTAFNVIQPVDGRNIEFMDNVTVVNAGSKNNTNWPVFTNGSRMTCHKDFSLDGNMKLQGNSELVIDGNYHGIYKYDGGATYYHEGVLYLTDGSSMSVGGNAELLDKAGMAVTASSLDVAGDFTAYGYFNESNWTGLGIYSNSSMSVGGDMRITCRSSSQYRNSYCSFSSGTLEIKGDLIDASNYNVSGSSIKPAWITGDDFSMTFSGSEVQTIKAVSRAVDVSEDTYNYNALGNVTVTSPGIRAEGCMFTTSIQSDAKVYGDVTAFNIKQPVDGRNIEFMDNVTVVNAGSKNNTNWPVLTNGSRMTCHKDFSLDGNMKLQGNSELVIDGSYHGIYKYNGGATYYHEGVLYLTDGSSMSVGGNAELLDKAGMAVTDSSLDVAGDFTAYGYFNESNWTGLGIYTNSSMSVGGDMQITCRSSSQYRNSYCNFSAGTLELKGDLIDATNYNVSGSSIKPAWKSTENAVFIFSGEGRRHVAASKKTPLGSVKTECGGLDVDGDLVAEKLLTDLDLYGNISSFSATKWNAKTVRVHAVSVFPSVTLPSDYTRKYTQNSSKSEGAYDAVYAPGSGTSYTATYYPEGMSKRSINQYAEGSLLDPADYSVIASHTFEWYHDEDKTQRWDFSTDVLSENTNLYGLDLTLACQSARSSLEALVAEAGESDPEAYTEESFAALSSAITAAQEALAAEGDSRAVLDGLTTAEENLRTAIDGLACAHDYQITDQLLPTCTEDGYTVYTCSRCQDTYTENAGALGHDFETEWTYDVEPTCTLPGIMSHHCTRCTEVSDVTEVKANGHDFTDWTEIVPECEGADIYRYRTCNACGLTETEGDIDGSHKWEDHYTVDVEPTCTTDGSQSIHCSRCGVVSDSQVIPAFGHDPEGHEGVKADYVHDGHEAYWVCNTCSRMFSDPDCTFEISEPVVIPKLDLTKSLEDAESDAGKAAADAESAGKAAETSTDDTAALAAIEEAEEAIKAAEAAEAQALIAQQQAQEYYDKVNRDPDASEEDKAAAAAGLNQADINVVTAKSITVAAYSAYASASSAAAKVASNQAAEAQHQAETAATSEEAQAFLAAAAGAAEDAAARSGKAETAAQAAQTAADELNGFVESISSSPSYDAISSAVESMRSSASESAGAAQTAADAAETASEKAKESETAAAAAVEDKQKADRAAKMGSDGTALGEGASEEAAEIAITGMKSDKDPAGSVFRRLQLKSTVQGKSYVTLKWKPVSGAAKYVIYGNKCGPSNKMRQVSSETGTSRKVTALPGSDGKAVKLKKGTYYKFLVVAVDAEGNVISASKVMHAATSGGKAGNYKSISTKAKKNKVSLRKGKTFRLAAKAKAVSSKRKVAKHRGLCYESSNPAVATVSSKGVIKGKKKGTCYVYVYAQNGVSVRIKVTVK